MTTQFLTTLDPTNSSGTTMTHLTIDSAEPSRLERTMRNDIDQLHADYLSLARRAARLSAELDQGSYWVAGGRVRAAVATTWRAAEEVHAAFHHAPPRGAEPDATLARLCRRRMRYLSARFMRRVK
ncbi:hypothetical protein SMD44_p20029 (plasmid) [Streptomyces alboflavus]|uniref:Uncharacterized protein n=1 Tax=Streptomyces alboflavus TaxID=67267 RepID=A0A291W5J3_9ACTN|nr:DUF6238 family protein [Streptomyces alboflavus]ATM24812.1 hypothetical protein SMD44_p20029 [Streptomyces alboflavus]